jgi:uncharacterized membrane protein (UPF0127 family)
MNKKDKWSIPILLMFAVLIVLLIVFSDTFITNTENATNEQLAVVTFFPANSTSVVMTCEVASSPEERLMGLMFREELPVDEGMLFVYEYPHNVSFWMKNVLIPLDIIFLNESGTVINVEEADVEIDVPDENLGSYCSVGPVLWVVEVNQDLCKLYGIGVGTNVSIEYL